MNTVLIVMWFAVAYIGPGSVSYYPQVTMTPFTTLESCKAAAEAIKNMANGKTIVTQCVKG